MGFLSVQYWNSLNKNEELKAGLIYACMVVWIQAFAVFGPLNVVLNVPPNGKTVLFLCFFHALGLAMGGMGLYRKVKTVPLVLVSGVITGLLTCLLPFINIDSLTAYTCTFLIVLGLASAYPSYIWAAECFALQTHPLICIATALSFGAIGSFLLTWFSFSFPQIASLAFIGLGLLTLLFAILLARFLKKINGLEQDSIDLRKLELGGDLNEGLENWPFRAVKVFVVFALTGFLTAGIMYNYLLPALITGWPDFINWSYIVMFMAYIFLTWYTIKRKLPSLAILTLSLLGAGLVLILVVSVSKLSLFLSYTFFIFSLVGIELYYWTALCTLSWKYETCKVFGWGLALNLLGYAFPSLLLNTGLFNWPHIMPVTSILGLALIFLATPYIFQYSMVSIQLPAQEPETAPLAATSSSEFAAAEDNNALVVFSLPLTPAESRVFALLRQGATDMQMADELYISRNTVKFHVRNILHKAKVKNRRELLALLAQNSKESL